MVVVVVAPSSVIAASDVVGAFGRGVNVERGRPVSGVRSCRGVDVDSHCPEWSRQLDVSEGKWVGYASITTAYTQDVYEWKIIDRYH